MPRRRRPREYVVWSANRDARLYERARANSCSVMASFGRKSCSATSLAQVLHRGLLAGFCWPEEHACLDLELQMSALVQSCVHRSSTSVPCVFQESGSGSGRRSCRLTEDRCRCFGGMQHAGRRSVVYDLMLRGLGADRGHLRHGPQDRRDRTINRCWTQHDAWRVIGRWPAPWQFVGPLARKRDDIRTRTAHSTAEEPLVE